MTKTRAEVELDIFCPKGGNFYSCERSGFIGCCTIDPCDGGKSGVCPLENVRYSAYRNTDGYDKIKTQTCSDSVTPPKGNETLWYTCNAAEPPFFGCCQIPACNPQGCPQENLGAAIRTHSDSDAAIFKELAEDDKGLSKGAIAGIAAGIGAAVVIGVAVAVWFFLKKKKNAKRPAVPAKPDSYIPNTPHTPHGTMAQFSPAPTSAHPTINGAYPFSPQQPGADSPAYYFPQHMQHPQQHPGSPPYYHNGVPVPPIHTPIPHGHPMHKAFYEQSVTPLSSQNFYAAELPSMPDTPAQPNTMVNRAASTTTYKGGSNKRESAMSRMTAPPEAQHTHNHQLAELGPTQITPEIGDSTTKLNQI